MGILGKVKNKFGNLKETKRRMKYASLYKKLPIDESVVLYDSFMSRGMLDNPYAIFKKLKSMDEFKNLKHIWAIEDMEGNAPIIERFASDNNVVFVKRHDKAYLKALTSAKYIVTNVSMPYYYVKKDNQILINTWHGVPLKKLGYDLPDATYTISNVLRSMLSSDYMVSPCPHLTNVYLEKYKLDGLYTGKIMETGYPRCDLIGSTSEDEIVSKLAGFGIDLERNSKGELKKVILYAPTWKGTDFSKPDISTDEYFNFKKILESNLDMDKYQILIKPHQVVYKALKDRADLKGLLVPAYIDADELMSITDILVSDYSSIFFDFLITGKPVLFYVPDLSDYEDYHGLYFDVNELPGPATDNLEEICNYINNIKNVNEEYKKKYLSMKNICAPFENGNSTDLLIDIVFKNKDTDNWGNKYRVLENFVKKKRLLLYGGGMLLNGITTSFINLVDHIDYDKYDVTVFAGKIAHIPEKMEMLMRMNKNARTFPRISYTPATFGEQVLFYLNRFFGFKGGLFDKLYPKKCYDREFRRCFGDAKFDVAVDFSGYGSFYSILMLSAGDAKKLIWQHNDLETDRLKKVDGKQPHKRELKVVFSTYKFYDKIVGCSEATMNINRQKIGYENLKDKCTFVENIANFTRVLEGAKVDITKEEADLKGYDGLLDDNIKCIVNMGRFSPEKNHEQLIRAYDRYNKNHPDTRLYIIGEGPLESELKSLCKELGLDDRNGHKNVIFTGKLENPFSVMKNCDLFILPSIYEGQPVVLLEARALHLPIIMSDFDSAPSSLKPNGQLVCKKDADSIYEALEEFNKGNVPTAEFDANQYNVNAMRQFYEAIN